MEEPKKRQRALTTYTNPEFEPYLLALGHVTLAWNDLQEQLAEIFWMLLRPTGSAALAVWHSTRSDRAQREMLRAVVKTYADNGEEFAKTVAPKIEWLLGKAENLEAARNDAIHSPLMSMREGSADGVVTMVRPSTFQENPRAISLDRRKDLLAEFYWCRDTAIALSDYGYWLMVALDGRSPLPDIPPLPNRGQKNSRQDQPPPPSH
jgi:hypothetical protein